MSDPRKWMPPVLALVASVLLTLGVQHFVVSKGMARIQARLDERAAHLADIRGKAMAQGAVIAAGSDPIVQATALGTLPPDNPQVLAKLALIRDKLGADNLFILSSNGVVESYFAESGLASLTGKSLGWRPYFTGAIAGTLTVYAALGSNTRERGIYVAAPIQAETAGFAPVGVIVAKLNFGEIDRFLDEESIPVAVVSPEGIVFASNRPDWRYRVLGGPEQLYAVKNGRRASRAYEKTPPVLLALDADGTMEQQGRELTVLSAPIGWADPTGAWRMVGFVDPAVIFGWPARLGTAAALFLVLMLLCAWLQARRRAHWQTRQVFNLLNNSGEGFLAFSSDLIVYPEYSRACEAMLGMSPAGRDAAELLFGADPAQVGLMRETIASVLVTEDPDIREAMLSLLPKEVRRGERLLAVEFRPTGEARFMAILTDISEERRVAAQLELEQRHLRLVVAAVSDNRGFFETIDAFREFLARRDVSGPAGKQAAVLDVREIYREIHTFKGLLNQFSFPSTPQILHEIESDLARLLPGQAEPSANAACIDFEHIGSVFESDLSILTDTLGEDFLAQGRTLVLSEDQARELESLSRRLLRGEAIDTDETKIRRLLGEIVRLRKIRLADTLKSYERFVQQTAQRLEKRVAPLVIRGDDIWVDPQVYKPFTQSLVHVFRNAVVHGLEAMETRWECDKAETGTIACTMRSDDARIYLTIADDGAGLDLAQLREKAQENEVPGARNMNDAAAANLVFMDGVSTQEEVTALAGRGVGLAAVRSEAEKLGGSVEVHSTAGQGTEFRFVLPLLRETARAAAASGSSLKVESVMNSALDRTREYLADELGVQAELPMQPAGVDALTLRDMTAVIGVGGSIDLWIAFSFQGGLIQALFERMTQGMAIAPDEVEKFKRNAAGEIANIVVGHCTYDLQERDAQSIPITPPVVLEQAKTIARRQGATFRQRRMITAFGTMDVNLIGPGALFTASLDYAS